MKFSLFFMLATLFQLNVIAQKVPNNTGSSISREEAQQCLDFHNKVRKEVGAPPLEWSEQLSSYAQEWANKLAKHCTMEHRPIKGKWARKYGENLFWGKGKGYTGRDACKAWYGEKQDYNFQVLTPSNFHNSGHYTQMVWRGTEKVGMASVICKDGATIIVANYDPPGNIIGQKPF